MARRPLLRLVASFAALLLIYYVAPWPGDEQPLPAWLGLLLVFGGVLALAILISLQLIKFTRAPSDADLRLQSLVILLGVVVFFFATVYYLMATRVDGQFDGLATRTDSLYFTMTTVATTGFGDVHASGQESRGVVTVQMAFNLVYVAAIATTLGSRIRERARRRAQEGPA